MKDNFLGSLAFHKFYGVCMSSPLLATCGSLGICCLVLSDQQLVVMLGKIRILRSKVLKLLRQFCHRCGCGETLIKRNNPQYRIDGHFKSKSDYFSREQGTWEDNFNHWTIMAFRLVILLFLLAFFTRGWSSVGCHGKLPWVQHLASRSSYFCSTIFRLSGSSWRWSWRIGSWAREWGMDKCGLDKGLLFDIRKISKLTS